MHVGKGRPMSDIRQIYPSFSPVHRQSSIILRTAYR